MKKDEEAWPDRQPFIQMHHKMQDDVNIHDEFLMKKTEGGDRLREHSSLSSSRYSKLKAKMDQYSTKFLEDEDGLKPEERWFLPRSKLLEKDGNHVHFWEGHWASPPHVRDWAVRSGLSREDCQSPSPSESSSSLSTRESSSFSGLSEASSSFVKRDASVSAGNQYSDFGLPTSDVLKLPTISTVEISSETDGISGRDLVKFRLDQGFWHSPSGSVVSHNDRHNRMPDYSGPLEQVGAEFDVMGSPEQGITEPEVEVGAMCEARIANVMDTQELNSGEFSNEGWSSDSNSSIHSWASAYSQEFSSESGNRLSDTIPECEEVKCGRPRSKHVSENYSDDPSKDDVEYVDTLRQVQRLSSTQVENNRMHPFTRKSLKISRIKNFKTNSEEPSIDTIEFQTRCTDGALYDSRESSHSLTCNVREVEAETDNTHLKSAYQASELQTDNSDAGRDLSNPLNNSAEVSCETIEPVINQLPPRYSSRGTVRARSMGTRNNSGSDQLLRSISHNSLGSPIVKAAGLTKPSRLKSRHSAVVEDKFPSAPLHGYFRFVEQGDSPCYTFFVDESDEVFFARACKPERLSRKQNCDWIYTFHSRKDDGKIKGTWKGWGKKERQASDLVGKMRVFSVRSNEAPFPSDKRTKDTRFVLFDNRRHQSAKNQSSMVDHSFNNFANPMCPPIHQRAKAKISIDVGAAHQGHSNSSLHESKANKHGMDFYGGSLSGSWNDCEREHGKTHFSKMELAAIVIRTFVEEEKVAGRIDRQKETKGWGAKFLVEKGSSTGWGLGFLDKNKRQSEILEISSDGGSKADICKCGENNGNSEMLESEIASRVCQKCATVMHSDNSSSVTSDNVTATGKKSKDKHKKVKVDMNVILPAGEHSFPIDGMHGATPLIERWQSGGNCDCGGWDMGCGLSVFRSDFLTMHHGLGENVALTSHDRVIWPSPGNPFKIFTQGRRRRLVLGLEILQAGSFSLSFSARFSPLQAFATAVAILHQQITQR